jgi:hypothetical protein
VGNGKVRKVISSEKLEGKSRSRSSTRLCTTTAARQVVYDFPSSKLMTRVRIDRVGKAALISND